MLIRQGSERNLSLDRRLAAILAAIAGALNTAAFQAVGFFSANMTGNVSLLSSHIAASDWGSGLLFLMIIVTFIGGAFSSTLLINAGRRRKSKGVYALGILTEAVLMACLGCVVLWVPEFRPAPTLILGLSFLMGLQNAIVTRISSARVRTTHVSGMSTDIGIELGQWMDLGRGESSSADARQVISRLRLHVETVIAFLVGGVIGVLAYRAIGLGILLVAAALLLVMAIWGLLRLRYDYFKPGRRPPTFE